MDKIEDILTEVLRFSTEVVERNVEAAKDEYIKILIARTKDGQGEKGAYSAYSKSHKYRREKKGLQTAKKDLHFSGTLFGSYKPVKKEVTKEKVTITLDFTGAAHKRPDQRQRENTQVAQWLGQFEGMQIHKLTKSEREDIENKYNVRITYDT